MNFLEQINPLYSLSGLVVGMLVGMTGVGGGSLMTPLLILMFGIHPATAVGTDLLYAAATKAGGTIFHGLLRDVSVSGAKFIFDDGANKQSRPSPGDTGVIVVDGLGEVPGTIVRLDKGGVVFTFDLSGRIKDQIVADIMIALNEMDIKPEA